MEIEDHTESLRENIHHAVHHGDAEKSANIMRYAVTSAFYAILAAMTSMMAGFYANEAIIMQMKSSGSWSYYQAKSIKMNLVQSKLDVLTALNQPVAEVEQDKIQKYKDELTAINEQSQQVEHELKSFLTKHIYFSRAVTSIQIAVAMTAFAIFVKKESFWIASIVFAVCGVGIAVIGFF